jgi:PST family polysaccharide transporter
VAIASRAVTVVIQVGATLFLARLLSPADFGLVAMVTAITGFAPVAIDLGTRDAAVQKDKITEDEVSGLFWMNIAIGGLLTLVMAAGSPLIAKFYREPTLTSIAVWSSFSFILLAVSCQHYALLRRAMMFQKIAWIEIGSSLIGAIVAVIMAFKGSAYWALVLRPLLTAVVTAVGVWCCCPWIPGVPRITQGMKEMVKFGLNVTGFTMADYVRIAADRVVLGRARGAVQVGFYQNALLMYDNLMQVLYVPLHSVATAGLSKLRDNVEELRRAWAKALSGLCFFAMPAFAILALIGEDLLVILLGQKWHYTGVLFSVFCLRGVAFIVDRTQGWLHVAAGRADRWMRWGIISSVAQLLILAVAFHWGPMGVAVGYAIAAYITLVPTIAYSGAPFGITARDVVRVVGPQLVCALAAAGAGFALKHFALHDLGRIARMSILLPFCGCLYLVLILGLFRMRQPLDIALSVARNYVPVRVFRFFGFDLAPVAKN